MGPKALCSPEDLGGHVSDDRLFGSQNQNQAPVQALLSISALAPGTQPGPQCHQHLKTPVFGCPISGHLPQTVP